MSRMTEMEAFATVIEEGGFTSAARKLGVSKSAVSKHITALETRLGARLLSRTTRSVAPTEIGAAFYDRASRILNDAGRAEALVSELQSTPSGTLRVSAPRDFGSHRLRPHLTSFLTRYPEIALQLELTDTATDLVADGFDVAIRIGDQPDSSLRVRKLTSQTASLVASPTYLETHGQPQEPSDLLDHRLLAGGTQADDSIWHLNHGDGTPARIRFAPALAINDGPMLLDAAIDGQGIARLPTFLTADPVARGVLLPVLAANPAPQQNVYAVFAPGAHTPPKLRAFLNHFASVLACGPKCAR